MLTSDRADWGAAGVPEGAVELGNISRRGWKKECSQQQRTVQDKLKVMRTCWYLPLEICSADSSPSNPEPWATLSAIDFKELGGSGGWREWEKKKKRTHFETMVN